MRAALALVVVAILLAVGAAEARDRCRLSRFSRTLECGPSLAFFEFAPTSGAGMPTACSTTAPTGAKGEVLTFTRTGNATCSKKGLATTGIADGDLVVMSGNVARVEPDSDGVLGLRVEGARTNNQLRSEEIDNASWLSVATGVANPTLNGANAAVAPDGTTTAEDYTFPATTAGQDSVRGQNGAAVCPSTTCAYSIYVKGHSGSGTLDICRYGNATGACSPCNYVADSWTRCVYVGVGDTTNNATIIGNSTKWNGGTARSSNRVYIWGAQVETGAYATSYIPTVAAAATRNAETAYFTIAPGAHTNYSMAMTFGTPRTAIAGYAGACAWASGPTYRCMYADSASTRCESFNSTALAATRATVGPFDNKRISCRNDGNERGIYDGAEMTPSAAATRSVDPTRLYVGSLFSGASTVDSIASKVCFEPNDSARCR